MKTEKQFEQFTVLSITRDWFIFNFYPHTALLKTYILIVKNFFSQNRFIVTLYMTAAFWTLCLIK